MKIKNKIIAIILSLLICISSFTIYNPIKQVHASSYTGNTAITVNKTGTIWQAMGTTTENYYARVAYKSSASNRTLFYIYYTHPNLSQNLGSVAITGVKDFNGYTCTDSSGTYYAWTLNCNNGYAALVIPSSAYTDDYNYMLNDIKTYITKMPVKYYGAGGVTKNKINKSQLDTFNSQLSNNKLNESNTLITEGAELYSTNTGLIQSGLHTSVDGARWSEHTFAPGKDSDTDAAVCADVVTEYAFRVIGYIPYGGTTINIDLTFTNYLVCRATSTITPTCNETNATNVDVYYNNIKQTSITKGILSSTNHSTTNTSYTKKDANVHTVTKTCPACNEILSTSTEAHSWDNGKVTKAATCTETGIKTFTCTKCGQTKTETIEKSPHVSDNTYVVKTKATCTTDGEEVQHCKVCNAEMNSKVIKATGHKEDTPVKEKVLESTCISKGSYDSVVYCKICKTELKREHIETAPLGHDYQLVNETPATTKSMGIKNYKCSRCSETKQEITPMLDVLNEGDRTDVVNNIYNIYSNSYNISKDVLDKIIEYIQKDTSISEDRKKEIINNIITQKLTKEDIEYINSIMSKLNINDDALTKLLKDLLEQLNKKDPTPTVNPTPTPGPTVENPSIDPAIYDKLDKILTDMQGLFNGKKSQTFTSDGNTFKIEFKDGKYIVSMLDDDGKWVAIPESSSIISKESVYSYTVIQNQDGTKSIQVLKNKKTKLKKVVIKSFKSTKKKKATVQVKKMTNITGYQIKVSTSKKFTKKTSKSKNITLKKMKKSKYKYTFTKLKSKKTYYVKARAYKVVNGKKVYGNWSKVKKVKVK